MAMLAKGLAVLLGTTAALPDVTWAQGLTDWWPDPLTHRGLAAWVSYSRNYDTLWSDPNLAGQEVASIAQSGVEVVLLAISSSPSQPHLQRLPDRTDQFTSDVQDVLNLLTANEVRACASILSRDDFTGSPGQMAMYVLVDNLLAFNASLGPNDTGFNCVATDLEMTTAGSHTTVVYDLWRQFHANMRDRIASGGGGIHLLAWIQGPDYLISQMDSVDRDQLMQRENITFDVTPGLFDGAFQYFTVLNALPIFDAVIPMWFFTSQPPYFVRLDHNIRELDSLGIPNLYLVAGVMIQNSTGVCCSGCVRGRSDFDDRLNYNDSIRQQFSEFIGTGVFLWPIPADWTCP
jgi:hypothetical protein